jgi:hypothetical protein
MNKDLEYKFAGGLEKCVDVLISYFVGRGQVVNWLRAEGCDGKMLVCKRSGLVGFKRIVRFIIKHIAESMQLEI